ncbi:MAG: hypothetical protein EOP04_07920 [Proteobacteria bacterium]|nr:MAG: hypothetical protein EOP04_07920 [Pseudomonadota bacterium]
MKHKIGKILGRSISIFAVLGSILVDYANVQLFKNPPLGFWSFLMLLGLFIYSASDASELRARYRDHCRMSVKEYFVALGLSVLFLGGGLWLAN